MHSYASFRRPALLAAVAAFLIPCAIPPAPSAAADDGAGVAVARISMIEGSAAVQRGDADAPSAAAVNAPVLGGDFVTTGAGSRAEVQVDGGTLVRLGENVQMRFTHLDADQRALQLAEGTVELRLLRGTDGRSDIDTPSVTVRPRAGGSYRVTVTDDGRTLVTVRSGDAAIVTPQGDRALTPGSTLVADGPASNPTIATQPEVAVDAFDRFNQERDARYERAVADNGQYVSSDLVGSADLDAYGRWVPDPRYGEVWVPSNVASDWAPYRDGRWVWEDAYGWTWIGAEPWGWAPYHYGSWYRSPVYGWAWYPPPVRTYVPWRPAIVAFFSFGGSGFGLGWVPLAPFEPWHPWWGSAWGGNTTIVNNTTVVNNYYGNGPLTRYYHNAQYGVVTMPGKRFTEGRFDRATIVKPGSLRNVQIVRGALPVVPTTANLRYSDRPVAPQLALRPAIVGRTFAGDANAVHRVPFEQTRAAVATATHVHATTNAGVAGTASGLPRAPSDPWSRFGSARGAGVPVTDGAKAGIGTDRAGTVGTARAMHERPAANAAASATTGTSAGTPARGAWSRFDGTQAQPRHTMDAGAGSTSRAASDGGARTNRVDVPARASRTYDAPARAVPAPRSAGSAERGQRAAAPSARQATVRKARAEVAARKH